MQTKSVLARLASAQYDSVFHDSSNSKGLHLQDPLFAKTLVAFQALDA